MRREFIHKKLNTTDGIASLLDLPDFSPIYEEADRMRREAVGDTVHLRAIIEFSNVCRRQCSYCGLNCNNKELPRYRMTREEIVATASEAVAAGYRTIVLQSGEDAWFTAERLGEIIADIKALKLPDGKIGGVQRGTMAGESSVSHGRVDIPAGGLSYAPEFGGAPAVTVSCGERLPEDYRYWREKGADRYLLKHETADPELYDMLHPCGTLAQRKDCLKTLHSLGYETGSGFMVGLPGQTLETLGRDLLLLKEIPCKMAGIGPFIANPKTPLTGAKNGDPELAKRCVAIARLLLPEANLPLTTALSVLSDQEGEQKKGSRRISGDSADDQSLQSNRKGESNEVLPTANPFAFGANVIMKKVTPDAYKAAYEIYPATFKPTNINEDRRALERMIRHYDRTPL